jgi:hypothetical protein
MSFLLSFLLAGAAFAVAFASFVVGRFAAGSLFRVGDRVPPFGEAPPSGFEAARPGARLAITLAGPLGVYLFAAALCTAGLLLGARHAAAIDDWTTIEWFGADSAARAAGLRAGDRITTVGGVSVRDGEEIRAAIAARPAGPIEVGAERDGRALRVQVVPGPSRRLGVQMGPSHVDRGLGEAIVGGVMYPYRSAAGTVAALARGGTDDLSGPVGITSTAARGPTLGDRLVTVGGFESIGVVFFLLGSIALWPPRVRRRAAIASPAAVPAAPADPGGEAALAGPGRPGVRLIARVVDGTLFGLGIVLVAPNALAVLWLAWFPVEALLLSRWGFTPGKWLLRIAVRDREGRRPTFRDAFRRVALVWAYGMGADTPFGLATAVLARDGLKRKGTTYWDAVGGYEVHHRPVGAARAVVAGLILLLTVAWFALRTFRL